MSYLSILCIIITLLIMLTFVHDIIFHLKCSKQEYYYMDGTNSNYEFGINSNKILHRIGKPAVIFKTYEEYYENGLRHRLDGPAVIIHKNLFASHKLYYVYDHQLGNNLSKKDFERLKNIKLKEVVFS